MRIVVTGGGGRLACALERVGAEDADHSVIALDHKNMDVTDPERIDAAIKECSPHVIINTAGYTAVDLAEGHHQEAFRLNADAVENLATACLRGGVFFIHYSTEYVFDGNDQSGYSENDPPRPLNVYGQSKWEGERRLIQVANRGPLRYFCIRTSRLFGRAGTSPHTKPSFVDLILQEVKNDQPIRAVDGEVSSPTLVDDLARGTLAMLGSHHESGIYHRTNDGACTWLEFAQEIVCLVGRNPEGIQSIAPSDLHRPAERPAYAVLRSTKLPPLRHWKEALREYLST